MGAEVIKKRWKILGFLLAALVGLGGGAIFSYGPLNRWANRVTIPEALRRMPAKYDLQPPQGMPDRSPIGRGAGVQTLAPPVPPGGWTPDAITLAALQAIPPTDPDRQLLERLSGEKLLETFRREFFNKEWGGFWIYWAKSTNNQAQAMRELFKKILFAWLAARQPYFDQMYRVIGDWPLDGRVTAATSTAGRREFERWLGRQEVFYLIVAEGRMRLAQGDEEGTERACLSLLKLFAHQWGQGEVVGGSFFLDQTSAAINLLFSWLDGRRLEPERAARLRAALAGFERSFFTGDTLTRLLKGIYRQQRGQLVSMIENNSWQSYCFGWDVSTAYHNYYFELPFPGGDLTLPRVDRYIATANRAIQNKKRAPELLAPFDRLHQVEIDHCTLGFADFQRQLVPVEAKMPPELQRFGVYFFDRYQPTVQWKVAEARLHLVRAALELQLNPEAAEKAHAGDGRRQSDDPWRDPFTDQCLKVIEPPAGGTKPKIIYSLGPDLKDQQGAVDMALDVEWSYFNPHADIVIRVR